MPFRSERRRRKLRRNAKIHLADRFEEARAAVFSWIEGWYNTHRRHSSLGYLSPIVFEQAFIEKQSPGARSFCRLRGRLPYREIR